MNETCDRCGPAVRAAYRASRSSQLYLCGHCANQLRLALSAHGWAVRPIDTYTLAPQAR
jgi:uroporphyrinogen-III synthase